MNPLFQLNIFNMIRILMNNIRRAYPLFYPKTTFLIIISLDSNSNKKTIFD